MKITAKITHRYEWSKNVRVVLEMATDGAVGEIGDFLTSPQLAGSFIDELDRLNRLGDEIARGTTLAAPEAVL